MFRKSKKKFVAATLKYNSVQTWNIQYVFCSVIFNINSIGALQERIAFHKRKIYFKYKLISSKKKLIIL